jgi:choline transporter-like protein 2/4/5
MVWFTVISANIAAIAMTASLWSYYFSAKSAADAAKADDYAVDDGESTTNYQVSMLLALAVIVSVATGILLLLTVFLRNRIRLAIAIIQETSKAIRRMPFLIFFPIGKYVVLCLLTAWTIYIWA